MSCSFLQRIYRMIDDYCVAVLVTEELNIDEYLGRRGNCVHGSPECAKQF